jgi:superfamily I DNA/RNA helicase
VVLNRNYRSTRQILAGAYGVVSHNRKRKAKDITSAAGDGDPIVTFKADDEEEEAQWVAQTILDHEKYRQFRFSDHALLFRTNVMMRRFEEALRNNRIPYRIQGSMSFFDRKEIKDVVSYMRFFANPDDEISLVRVLKVPGKGIGSSTLEALEFFAAARGCSLWESVRRNGENERIGAQQKEVLTQFVHFFSCYDTRFRAGDLSASLHDCLEQCGYFGHLKRAYSESDDAVERRENIDEIIHGLETWEHKNRRRSPRLSGYLHEISLMTADIEDEREEKKSGTTLMTIHRAKGLEFPVVIVPSLDNAMFPSPRSVDEGHIDEERRLFYVAMTRAQRMLILTWPTTKVFRKREMTVSPTQFLTEIPEEFLDGPLGAKQDQEYKEYAEDFFKQMVHRFGAAG